MNEPSQTHGSLSYVVPPKVLPGFPRAYPVKGKTPMGGGKLRKRWKDPDTGDILEWDYQHGKLERYNDRGGHLGEFDPDSGQETKPANAGRQITPSIWKVKKRRKMSYYLTWFEKNGDGYLGETLLPNVDEDDVRNAFGLDEDEYAGDCLPVGQNHIRWLNDSAQGVNIRLDLFDYFVEACQSVTGR